MWFPSNEEKQLNKVKKELQQLKVRNDLKAASALLRKLQDKELYDNSDPTVRQRMDYRKQAEKHYNDMDSERKERLANKIEATLPKQAVNLLAKAVNESSENVKVKLTESILDDISTLPFAFDLIQNYRNLLVVPAMIREYWSYKSSVIRSLPMLDWIRWVGARRVQRVSTRLCGGGKQDQVRNWAGP